MFLIALTGYGKTEDRVRALTSGFNYHLTKPVDPGELDMILKKLTPGRSDESAHGGVKRGGGEF